MKLGSSTVKKSWLLVALPLVTQIGCLVVLENLLSQYEQAFDRQQLSKSIQIRLRTSRRALEESIVPLVVANLSDRAIQHELFQRVRTAIRQNDEMFNWLDTLEPKWHSRIQEAHKMAVESQRLVNRAEDVLGPNSKFSLKQRHEILNSEFTDVLNIAERLFSEFEKGQAVNTEWTSELDSRSEMIIVVLLLLMLATNLMVASFAFQFNQDLARRLDYLVRAAEALAVKKPMPEPLGGLDEIADVEKGLRDARILLDELTNKENVMLENTSEALFALDLKGRFISVGASAGAFFYGAEELPGSPIINLLPAKQVEKLRNGLKVLSESQCGSVELETTVKRLDGSYMDCLLTMRMSSDNNSIVGVAHDISQRKEAERMKQRFVSIVSHDLRAPLASITGSLALITGGKRGQLTDVQIEEVSRCEAIVDGLMLLVEDLLAMERVESGKLSLKKGYVSVLELFEQSIETILSFATRSGVALEKTYVDVAVLGDQRRLEQVVVNILSNAIKFSPRGGKIKIGSQTLNNGLIELRITDQGPGIKPEDRERIFERFQQTDTGERTSIKGTGLGLGLAIAKAIVEEHGGAIGVEGEPGEGASFYIRLVPFPIEDDRHEAQ